MILQIKVNGKKAFGGQITMEMCKKGGFADATLSEENQGIDRLILQPLFYPVDNFLTTKETIVFLN